LFGTLRPFAKVILTAGLVTIIVVFAGCGSNETVNNEASTSAIRAAEEVGASNVPTASLYLQLAKEELENAKGLQHPAKRKNRNRCCCALRPMQN
jgi:hypothetical protein